MSEFTSIICDLGGEDTTSAQLHQRVTEALAKSSFPPDDPPAYVSFGLRRAAARDTCPWIQIPPGEQGLAWAMADLVELIPCSWFADEAERDYQEGRSAPNAQRRTLSAGRRSRWSRKPCALRS